MSALTSRPARTARETLDRLRGRPDNAFGPTASASREDHVPVPRRARFGWDDVPLRWLPDEPQAMHVINTLHLFLPAGERWFIKVMKQALPHVTDELLREQVRAFMTQEGQHATAHGSATGYLRSHGFDVDGYERRLDVLFDDVLGDRELPPRLDRAWLDTRLAIIAAVEHYTAVLGEWILKAEALDAAGADPTMMDLLRWHGAEEVEHRSVAFDLYQHVCGSWALRAATAQVVFPALLALVMDGTRVLVGQDAEAGRWRPVMGYVEPMNKGLLPRLGWLALQGPRYVAPGFHPSQEGDLARAFAYIAGSPSHLRAMAR